MDLSFPPEAEAFRLEVQAFLAAHLPKDWPGIGSLDRDAAAAFSIQWRQVLYDHGYIGITFPTEYGGGGRSKVDQIVLAQELARAGVPTGRITDTTSVKMLGNTLVRWGSDAQKAHYLPRILSGQDIWVQGYSEPNAGSDLASLALRAVPDDGGWLLSGQKIWTSAGMQGSGIFVLARTDPTARKHHGITFFLCPLGVPGIDVRPIRSLTGESEFCEVFFDEVRVPDSDVVGEVNEGWAVATSLLGLERGEEAATNPILFRAELDRLLELASERRLAGDPVVRDRLAWCYAQVEIMRFLGYRILTQFLKSGALGPEVSISKLYWSEYHQRAADLALRILGAGAMVRNGRRPYRHYRADDPGAANTSNSWIDVFLLNARSGTVYAGTSQIQRNVIAESVLGLPKEPVSGAAG